MRRRYKAKQEEPCTHGEEPKARSWENIEINKPPDHPPVNSTLPAGGNSRTSKGEKLGIRNKPKGRGKTSQQKGPTKISHPIPSRTGIYSYDGSQCYRTFSQGDCRKENTGSVRGYTGCQIFWSIEKRRAKGGEPSICGDKRE